MIGVQSFSFALMHLQNRTKTWLTKANNRKLIKADEFDHFMKDFDTIGIKLNNYINSLGKKSNDAAGE